MRPVSKKMMRSKQQKKAEADRKAKEETEWANKAADRKAKEEAELKDWNDKIDAYEEAKRRAKEEAEQCLTIKKHEVLFVLLTQIMSCLGPLCLLCNMLRNMHDVLLLIC